MGVGGWGWEWEGQRGRIRVSAPPHPRAPLPAPPHHPAQAANEDEMVEWIEAIQNNLECVPPEDADAVAGGEEDD